jgi:hypothetical protein
MSHVFVSYARADQARVRSFVEQLESSGFMVRWDQDLRGHAFDQRLKQWIDEASAIVVFWSSNSIGSNYVGAELNYANINKVISVRIDPIDPRSIPLKANTLDIIDLATPDHAGTSAGILKLAARCAELSQGGPPQATMDAGRASSHEVNRSQPTTSISVQNNKGVVAHTIHGPIRIGG